MILAFSIWLFYNDVREIELEPASTKVVTLKVVGRTDFIGASHKRLFHWSADGSLKLSFNLQDNTYVNDLYYDGAYYWISCHSGGPLFTLVFNKQGQLLDKLEGEDKSFRFFLPLKDELLAVTHSSSERLYQNPYFYQLQKVDFSYEENSFHVRTFDSFAKIRQKQRDYGFSFKGVFLAKRDKSYLVMFELEPNVLIYNAENIAKERRDGTQHPTDVEEIKLDLPEYVPPPEKFYRVKPPMSKKKFLELRARWLYSWSRITGFQNFRNGFLVAYGIPVCSEGECVHILGIQVLDRDLKTMGKLIKVEGNFFGVHQEEVFAFQRVGLSDGKEKLTVLAIKP